MIAFLYQWSRRFTAASCLKLSNDEAAVMAQRVYFVIMFHDSQPRQCTRLDFADSFSLLQSSDGSNACLRLTPLQCIEYLPQTASNVTRLDDSGRGKPLPYGITGLWIVRLREEMTIPCN